MYQTLIFDLDDTLTNDFENTKVAFQIVMQYKKETYQYEKFMRFHKIDKQTWQDFAKGNIDIPYKDNIEKKVEWIRASRFMKYFGENISYTEAVQLNTIYMDGLKKHVVPRKGAKKIIEYLHNKNYRIIIATNGPMVALQTKLEKIGIQQYIQTVFSAEEVGFAKPDPIFYDGLFKKAKITSKKDILLIGDELEKDIKGGIDYKIDTCWCNFQNLVNDKYPTKYEIHKLKELKNFL